jgi:hypothetical protein
MEKQWIGLINGTDMDVAIKYLATVSLLINIIFGILFFGLSPDQTVSSGEHHPQALNQSNVQLQDNPKFQVDLSTDKSLQDYYQKLLSQGFTADQTKPLVFTRLKARYIDSIQKPDDQFWRYQPLAQINYMEAMAKGYESIRGQLSGLYGTKVSRDPLFSDMFYPMANQYPFLSSSEQIAVQKMQIEMQKYSTQLQAEGGNPSSVPPDRAPANMLANLLGDQATKEYMLRTSPLANKMRKSGLSFTEDSFRKAFDLLVSVKTVQDPSLSFAVRDEINGLFGADDGLVLWAAIDPAFGLVKQVASQHGVTQGLAMSAYEMILAAKQNVSEAAAQRSSNPQQAMHQVQNLMTDLKNQLSQMVGEPAANDFINILNGRRLQSNNRRSNG